jgi:hypothetical protein
LNKGRLSGGIMEIKGLYRTHHDNKPDFGPEVWESKYEGVPPNYGPEGWERTPIGYLFKPVDISIPRLWFEKGIIEIQNQIDNDVNGRWGICEIKETREICLRRFPPIGKGRSSDLLVLFFNPANLPEVPNPNWLNKKYHAFISL